MTTDVSDRLAKALADRYRLERMLGEGGMATVYLAHDLKHDRHVAIKVLRPELAAALGVERFLAEIRTTARLQHPHILPLLDSGEAGGTLYYVMPFVAGETLRARLAREPQLPVEEALHLTREVADALGFAHDAGVIHRDIKPENVLLHGAHALVADFGIALAVSDAGGSRLTETGMSLGTPAYMSPEQATGERAIDARCDLYALGAVLYEMLAGEPPFTGPTARAIVAKLLTEQPVPLRVLRPSVPVHVEQAVAKALGKAPADRFATAGELVQALDAGARSADPSAGGRRRVAAIVLGALAVLAAVVGVLWARRQAAAPATVPLALRDRTQLTFTGEIFASAISPDGTQLASIARECETGACRYAVDVQDVGGTVTHRLLDGATSAYGLWWSPDRRNLIFNGTVGDRWGFYLLSALGGSPRFLPFPATFYGGDSLLVTPSFGRIDSVFEVNVTSLDGTVRDSIRVASAVGAGRLIWLSVSPARTWIAALVEREGHYFCHVFDRRGRVVSHGPAIDPFFTMPAIMAGDALWFPSWTGGTSAVVRVGVDPATGRLAERADTIQPGRFESFSVTADGRTLVVDAGTTEYAARTGRAVDIFQGRFGDAPMLRSSDKLVALLSPAGDRVLVRRTVPTSSGTREPRYSMVPFDGGTEQPLDVPGKPVVVQWADSTHVLTLEYGAAGTHAGVLDLRGGPATRRLDLPAAPDSARVTSVVALPDGWAWLDARGDRVRVQRNGRITDIAMPAWFGRLEDLGTDSGGHRLVVVGWNAGTMDTVGIAVVAVDGGTPALWARWPAEGGAARFLPDGSMLASRWDTRETVEFYRLTGPDAAHRIGREGRPAIAVTLADDLSRAAMVEVIRHGDAYMSKVVQP